MEVKRETITVSERVLEKNSKSYVESSVIVPDRKPDILKIIQADATCAVTGKRIKNGRLSTEGKVYVTILYFPDAEERCINTLDAEFDFDDMIDDAQIKEGMQARIVCDVEKIDVNLINSRKVGIRAEIGLDVEMNDDREINYISDLECTRAGKKCKNASFDCTAFAKSYEFKVKDGCTISSDSEICEILKTDVSIEDKEYKTVANKIVAKGNVCVSALYLSEDKKIEHTECKLPFCEVFETDQPYEDDIVDVSLDVIKKSCTKTPDDAGSMNAISFDITLCANVCVKRTKEIAYLSDCYFYDLKSNCKRKRIKMCKSHKHPRITKNIRESVACDNDMPRPKNVYNVVAKPYITSTQRDGDRINISAKLCVSILYLSDSEENPVCCQKAELPINENIEAKGKDEICIWAECEHISYSINGTGDVELRANVAFNIEECAREELDVIDDIETEPKNREPEVVIMFANGDESLWDIAKEYGVDIDKLAKMNDITDNEKIEKRRRIIIPTT